MLIIHIRSLDEGTLARRVYEEQKTQEWPGLAAETASFCQILGIEDCNETTMSKTLHRKIIMKACHRKKISKI